MYIFFISNFKMFLKDQRFNKQPFFQGINLIKILKNSFSFSQTGKTKPCFPQKFEVMGDFDKIVSVEGFHEQAIS